MKAITRSDVTADPLLKLSVAPIDENREAEGPNDGEYGPLLETVRLMCYGKPDTALHLIRLVETLHRTPDFRRECIMEEILTLAYPYTDHGQESLQNFLTAIEKGGTE